MIDVSIIRVLSQFSSQDLVEQIQVYDSLIEDLEENALPNADGLYFYFLKKIKHLRTQRHSFIRELHSRAY